MSQRKRKREIKENGPVNFSIAAPPAMPG